MIANILRIIALRPILTLSILGLPIILLIAVGLLTIMALKFFLFIVLPIVIVVWAVRKIFGRSDEPGTTTP